MFLGELADSRAGARNIQYDPGASYSARKQKGAFKKIIVRTTTKKLTVMGVCHRNIGTN